MDLSFLSMVKRSLVKIAIFVAVFSFGMVPFETGLRSALASPATVTVQGYFTNNITGNPVSGATVITNSYAGTKTATTDRRGFYKISHSLDPALPGQNLIRIWENKAGYPSGYDSRSELLVPNTGQSKITITNNFSFSPIPQDIPSETILDPISQQCRTNQSTYEYPLNYYHTGDYVGHLFDNVLFCTASSDSGFFDLYAADFPNAANQVNALVNRTGLSYTPTIYLVAAITWRDGVVAYAPSGGKEIVYQASYLHQLETLTHEVGHLVDWGKGPDRPANEPLCFNSIDLSKSHCDLSWWRNDMRYAASIASQQQFITGYFNNSSVEAFAETFAALETPDSAGSSNFTKREHAKYNIANTLLGSYLDAFTGSSQIHLPGTAAAQNAAMYVYKFVANAGNLDEYFPGTLSDTNLYNNIWFGEYMDTGVVPVKVRDCGTLKGNLTVHVGTEVGNTRVRQTSGVFPDGGGDLFDTLGTAVIMNVPAIPGLPISVDGYASANPANFDIIKGANPILQIAVESGGNYTYQRTLSWQSPGYQTEGMAYDPTSGNLFMSRFHVVSGTETSAVVVYDSSGNILRAFGQHYAPGLSHLPVELKMDSTGRVYILVYSFGAVSPRVSVYENDGTWVRDTTLPTSSGQWGDISIDPSNHLVYRLGGNVYIYSTAGVLINFYALSGVTSSNDSGFDNNFAISQDNNFYLLSYDFGMSQYVINIYDGNSGTLLYTFNPGGGGYGMAVDSYNKILVGTQSGGTYSVRVFDSSRQFLNSFNIYGNMPLGGQTAVSATGKFAVGKTDYLQYIGEAQIYVPGC